MKTLKDGLPLKHADHKCKLMNGLQLVLYT